MAATREMPETLYERERELEALEEAFAAAAERSAMQLVVVSGEAGVGKTTLVRRFCAGGDGRRRVLFGRCEPLLTPSPLAPLVDIAAGVGGPLASLLADGTKPHALALALLDELRSGPPPILVLEDVHWADDATLDVLKLLGRRREAPATVVVTYREEDVGRWHPLRLVLAHLEAGSARRMRLAPLSRAAVHELAAAGGADGDELFHLTGGNPYLVVEALAAGEEIPGTVRDVVLARAAAVGPAALTLLEIVSVSPPPLELSLLEEIAPNEVGALEECLESGLLVTDGERIRFRHELARIAFADSLSPVRARVLHRGLLRGLERHPRARDDAARLAHHAEAAGDAEAAVHSAVEAARHAAASGAHREAAAQYGRALRHATSLAPAEHAHLCTLRSFECYLTTQDEDALVAIQDAAARFRALGSRRDEANALRWESLVLFNMGRSREAASLAERAVELLGHAPDRQLAMAHCAQAAIALLFEDAARTTDHAERALAIIRPLDDRRAYVTALGSVGAAEALAGHESGRRTLKETLALAIDLGHEAEVGRIYALLAMAGSRHRSLAEMTKAVEAGLAFCEERDLTVWGRILLATRAWVELERGEWDRATDTVSLVLATRCTLSSAQALIVLGLLRARRGDPDPWTPLADASLVATRTGALWWTSQVAAARAEAAWLEGRAERIPAITEEAYRAALAVRSPWPTGELAVWRQRAGLEERPSLLAEPFASELRGDHAHAAESWRRAGCPYEAALALGEADDDELLRVALDELQRLGARPAAARVARRLRERGVRRLPRGPRPSTRANPANLTRRESEVLRLLAEGLTNREIGARLFLSPRTIENHVAAVLRKLGVTTRVQAAQLGARLGLVP